MDNSKDPQDPNDPTKTDDVVDPHDLAHQQSKPPSVTGEEDTMSGDMPQEAADIDEELGKVGLSGDSESVKPLDLADELEKEA